MFIWEGMSRTDVCQGELASLTLRPRLLRRVVPPGQGFAPGQYAGIFHFQFWQYGQWVDVVVDDGRAGQGAGGTGPGWDRMQAPRCRLNGSYEAMSGGYMNEAFVDFTGGLGESLSLKTPDPELYGTVQAALRRRSLLGAHIQVTGAQDREQKTLEGLVKGHAYSVIGTYQLDLGGRQVKLVRLRNPWGRAEWIGDWSDSSPLWAQLDPMQMSDFRRCFDALEICSLSPEVLAGPEEEEEEGGGWSSQTLQGRWVAGYSAGGHRSYHTQGTYWMNPQFHVALEEPDAAEGEGPGPAPTCTLLVSLSQCGRRQVRRQGQDFLPISLAILKVTEEYLAAPSMAWQRDLLSRLPAVAQTPYAYLRDVTLRCRLPPGHYLVVPSTYRPLDEAAFVLRLFAERTPTAQEIGDEIWEDARPLKVPASPAMPSPLVCEHVHTHVQGHQWACASVHACLGGACVHGWTRHITRVRGVFSSTRGRQRRGRGRLALPDFRDLWSRIKEWEAVFTRFDEDGSGTMNMHEMRLALEAAGFHLNRELNEAVTGKYRDRGLQLDFDGFVSCLVQLEAIFRLCKERDRNGDGVVTMTQQEWLALVALT
ncbi:calpain-12-like [Alligator sinensis]|uniref:Calpain-12-like n=1 Tax=Alligator sinensis TaxID=38654 RepID=A0A3Q0FTY5_ALLSI|nr:calpain-12-like [Alligator sinensis]